MTRREQMIIFRGKRIDNGEWVCGFMPYSEVLGNVHDNKELWGGNEL